MAKQKTTIVGENLTPMLLRELGAVDNFAPTPANFKPDGNWVNKYRIWTCHGYRESGNQDVGSLRVSRRAGSNETFTLEVHQEVVQTDELTNVIDATVECRNDHLASPVQWNLSSRFLGKDGDYTSELSNRKDSRGYQRADRTTGDWCLLEAVQRLAFEKQSFLSFDLLEGMSISKPGHRLFYRGALSMKTGDRDMPLYCFVQLGSAILPCEYWLDDLHRLLAVISMNKAYILEQ
ncbi:MAG TPA: hypothetical protein VMW24_25605 [Sedimentisphaerales bacterium]|nr:hypothetical protein [Sedimentisphaerales bacterium]